MNKAIKITLELKNLNPKIFNSYNIDDIIKIDIPKKFNSLNYNKKSLTLAYHLLPENIHNLDGFFDLVIPNIHNSTQKYGEIIWNEQDNNFQYEILNKTQSEINQSLQNSLDSDIHSVKNINHKQKGELFFDRIISGIERKVFSGDLDPEEAKVFVFDLYVRLEPLYKGVWRLVKINLSNMPIPVNTQLSNILNKIKNDVNNYILNNY